MGMYSGLLSQVVPVLLIQSARSSAEVGCPVVVCHPFYRFLSDGSVHSFIRFIYGNKMGCKASYRSMRETSNQYK